MLPLTDLFLLQGLRVPWPGGSPAGNYARECREDGRGTADSGFGKTRLRAHAFIRAWGGAGFLGVGRRKEASETT